jgi:membrane protein implicated in regulation of membrane protease activity
VDNSGKLVAERVWQRQRLWSLAADQAKRGVGRARTVGLSLGIAAAVLATAAAQTVPWSSVAGRVLAFLSAVAAGLAPLAAIRSGPSALRDWTRLRSVSEALKGEVYVFLAGAGPYRDDGEATTLLERADRIDADASDLAQRYASDQPAPARPLPEVSDVDSYAEVRVSRQIRDYYRPRAELMTRRVARIRRTELGLSALAVVLGAVAGAFGVQSASVWVAAVTTVAAAVTAHAAAARYAYQQLEFSRTAAELDSLTTRRAVAGGHTSEADDQFVEQCEQVISVQNEAWMAKWTATTA